ncbi:MAG: M18 family aminopeptidase [Desulfobacterium sp.]|nr:M18 family aminopeptidase [Desulfobacterium sp.]
MSPEKYISKTIDPQSVSMERFNQDLFSFIDNSPTPFHAVKSMAEELKAKGFIHLDEADAWNLEPGGRYCITRNESCLIAFIMGHTPPWESGIKSAGAHTDSPCLKVKPHPLYRQESMLRLGCEVYGGTLFNTWFDRGLNLAGRVTCRTVENGKEKLASFLINFDRPVAIIPSLAIHLDREANSNRTVNPELQLPPIFSLYDQTDDRMNGSGDKDSFTNILLDQISQEHPTRNPVEVKAWELSFSDAQPCNLGGVDNDMISAPRLDNLLSCFAAIKSLESADPSSTAMVILTDNEEVGSDTRTGARGSFLESVLSRMTKTPERLARTAARSFMISCDNAHGVHPAFREKHEANHRPLLNLGPVLKTNASQRYTTNSESAAVFMEICRGADLSLQQFVMRSDLGCGSTIGPAISAKTGIRTVDVGAATLAMHSVREMTGSKDPYMMFKALNHYFSLDDPPLLSLT